MIRHSIFKTVIQPLTPPTPNSMRTTIRNLVCAGLLLAASSPARALTIVRTNDASMSDPTIISPADAAAASAAFDYAAGQIMALYSDPVQINIILAATTDPSVLGQSTAPLVGTFTYDHIRTLLINDNTAHPSPDGTTSTAALPAVNPYACTTFLMARGLAKALGNIPSDATNDGTFTFGTSFTYTYDPANRAVAGKFDFIGVAFHEITEVMGRVARLNQTGNCNRPYDVFRFLGAGTQSLIFTDSNVYFSVNGGVTNLKNFNANGNGGDLGDWASGSNDAFNAFSSSGVENDLTPVDVRVMDVIGWNRVTTGGGPPNDQCTGAIALSTGVTRTDNTANATSTGDPTPTCVSNFGKGVWYTFTPTTNGTVTISTCASDFDTVLQIYRGSCGALTPVPNGCDDDNGPICQGNQASVSFAGTAGTTYRILAGGFGSTTGNLRIVASVTARPATDFNGDGHPDYALYNASTRQTFVWLLNGNYVHFGGASGPTLPAGWQVVGVADFNGDSHPDYALYNASTRQTAIWHLNGNYVHFGGASGPTLPPGWNLIF